jgi:hypothetical protein
MLEGLPPSALDPDAYPLGPTGGAHFMEARIAELEAQKRGCRTRDERRPINKLLHTLRGLLRWYKSRAGYVPSPQDLGLLEDGEGVLPAMQAKFRQSRKGSHNRRIDGAHRRGA